MIENPHPGGHRPAEQVASAWDLDDEPVRRTSDLSPGAKSGWQGVILWVIAASIGLMVVAYGLTLWQRSLWTALPQSAAPAASAPMVTALAWNDVGKLRVGRGDGSVLVWDTSAGTITTDGTPRNGAVLEFLSVPEGAVTSIAPELLLLSVRTDNAAVAELVRWTEPVLQETGRPVVLSGLGSQTIIPQPSVQKGVIIGAPGSQLYLTANGQQFTLWDLAGEAEPQAFMSEESVLAAAPNGSLVVFGGRLSGAISPVFLPVEEGAGWETTISQSELRSYAFYRNRALAGLQGGGEDFSAGPGVQALAVAGAGFETVVAAVAEDGEMLVLRPFPPEQQSPETLPQLQFRAARAGLKPGTIYEVSLHLPDDQPGLREPLGISGDGRKALLMYVSADPSKAIQLETYDTLTGRRIEHGPLPDLPGMLALDSARLADVVLAGLPLKATNTLTTVIARGAFAAADLLYDRIVLADDREIVFLGEQVVSRAYSSVIGNGSPIGLADLMIDPSTGAIFILLLDGTIMRFWPDGTLDWQQSWGFPLGIVTEDGSRTGPLEMSLPEGTNDLLISAGDAGRGIILVLDRNTGTGLGWVSRMEGWNGERGLAARASKIWGQTNIDEIVLNDARSGQHHLRVVEGARSFSLSPSDDGSVAGFSVSTADKLEIRIVRLVMPEETPADDWVRMEGVIHDSAGPSLVPLPPVGEDALRLSRDGGRVLVRARNGQVFHGKTGFDTLPEYESDPRCCLMLDRIMALPAVAAELVPDGSAAVLALTDNSILHVDLDSGAQRVLGHLAGPVRALSVSPDGGQVAVASGNTVALIALQAWRGPVALSHLLLRPWDIPPWSVPRPIPEMAGPADVIGGQAVIRAASFLRSEAEKAVGLRAQLVAQGYNAALAAVGPHIHVLIPLSVPGAAEPLDALIALRSRSPQVRAATLHTTAEICPPLSIADTQTDDVLNCLPREGIAP